eukprot:531531_1
MPALKYDFDSHSHFELSSGETEYSFDIFAEEENNSINPDNDIQGNEPQQPPISHVEISPVIAADDNHGIDISPPPNPNPKATIQFIVSRDESMKCSLTWHVWTQFVPLTKL